MSESNVLHHDHSKRTAIAAGKTVEETLQEFNVDVREGLTSCEVMERHFLYGMNELQTRSEESLLIKFMGQFKDPLILLLIASAAVSVIMNHPDDAISITVAVIIVVTVAFVQEYNSEQSLQALKQLVPPTCHCTRDGVQSDILASELVPGDVVHISVGDRVPADCRVVEVINLEVDESSLTGETIPVEKHPDCLPNSFALPLAERRNIVYMGTLVRSGRAKAVVIGTGNQTEFGAIFEVMKEVEEKKTPLQIKMDILGKQLSVFSFGVIGFIVIVGMLQGQSLVRMFQIGVSLAVAAIPEGLPICVTVTLALGVMRMSKRNAIVKKLPAVEALGCTNIVCVDKTGTITQNEMTVSEVYVPFESVAASVTGIGYNLYGDVIHREEKVTKKNHPHIYNALLAGVICNNAEIYDGKLIGQPTDGALVACGRKVGITSDIVKSYERIIEVPFSSEKKWMAVCCTKMGDHKRLWYVKGMVEAILPRCDKLEDNCGRWKPLGAADLDRISREAKMMACRGLRVLALAYGESWDDGGMVLGGIVGISDPPREGVDEAVSRMRHCSIRTVMLTGDSKETAMAIAQKVGICSVDDQAISGSELDCLREDDLHQRCVNASVFYRTCPRHKMSIIRAFQQAGFQVAMTGDGVNDAPALKVADIGIAMGIAGTDVSKEAADMILVDDNFASILSAVEEGRSIFYNIKNFLRFQLSTSVAALSLISISTLFNLPNPLNAMQILWINIIMDGPPAQSLGVEPVDKDALNETPRQRDDAIITKFLIHRVVTSGLIIVAGTLAVFYIDLEKSHGEYIVSRRDRTMSFTTFVFFDMFNALSCRSATKSIFQIGFFSNKYFVFAVGGSLIGQLLVIYFPPLQAVFQTEGLYLSDLVVILLTSSTVFIVDELRKFWNHYYSRGLGQFGTFRRKHFTLERKSSTFNTIV